MGKVPGTLITMFLSFTVKYNYKTVFTHTPICALFCLQPLETNISLIAFANHVLFYSSRIICTAEILTYVKIVLIILLGGGRQRRRL